MIISISFVLSSPLASSSMSLGLILIYSALLLIIVIRCQVPTWMTITIFIIYVGGFLVLLTYFITLEPNIKLKEIALFTILIFSTVSLINNLHSPFTQPTPPHRPSISVLLRNLNIQCLMLLVTILFIILVIVVIMTCKNKGPIRPFSQ